MIKTKKISNNFGTTVTQSIRSAFAMPSTIVLLVVFMVIEILAIFAIPFIALEVGSKITPEGIAKLLMPQVFFPCLMCLASPIVSITVGALNRDEMTFVLSRPVSRQNYILAKYVACLVVTAPLVLTCILGFLIINPLVNGLSEQEDHFTFYGGFSDAEQLSWATIFVAPIFCWLFNVTIPIFFRNFVNKDSVIALIGVFATVGWYVLFLIIQTYLKTTVETPDDLTPTPETYWWDNVNVMFLCVPCIFYGVGTAIFFPLSIISFKKYAIKI